MFDVELYAQKITNLNMFAFFCTANALRQVQFLFFAVIYWDKYTSIIRRITCYFAVHTTISRLLLA